MPAFDVDAERITVFHIDDEYLFAHYFTRTDIFDDLSEYYNDDAYRFEVPDDAFDDVRERLADTYSKLSLPDFVETGVFAYVPTKDGGGSVSTKIVVPADVIQSMDYGSTTWEDLADRADQYKFNRYLYE